MNKKISYDAFGVDLHWDIRSTESYSEHGKALYIDTCCTCRKQLGNLWERWQYMYEEDLLYCCLHDS